MIKNIKQAYLLLSPSILWLLLFLLIPLGMIVVISFSVNQAGGVLYHFTLQNYREAFNSLYVTVIWHSILWAFSSTIISLLVSYPFAYFIANSGRYKNIMLFLVMIPFWTNQLIRLYAWIILLNDHGVVNNVLKHLGIVSQPIRLMNTPFAVLVGLVYGFLPFMILPIYSSIEQLDRRYLEAAEDLGAPPVKTFMKVILPLTFPGILAGFVITFVPSVSVFAVTDLMAGGKIEMIGNVIRDSFVVGMNWPLGSALSIFLVALVLLSLFVFMKFASKDKGLLFL